MNVEQARFNMIEQQIRPWDVLDASVLTLLSDLHREDFVPPASRALAFVDMQVPLLDGGRDGQTMLEPKVEARVLQELQLQPADRVLEIGAGSGYMAALMARQALQVFTLERVPALVRLATDNLRAAGIDNATVLQADGAGGLPAEGPFQAIVLSGSVAAVPEALRRQLAPGGRLFAIVGQEPVMRATLVTRTGDTGFRSVDLFDTVAPRLMGFGEPSRFHF